MLSRPTKLKNCLRYSHLKCFVYKQEAFFPTVVVCNQNPVRKDKIPADYFNSIKEEIRRLFGVQNGENERLSD